MAGHPRAKRGIVGAHIGVVGADEKASYQKIMHAIGRDGERKQRADADQDPLALAGFRRLGTGSNRRRCGRRIGRRPVRRLGGAARDSLVCQMSTKRFERSRGNVAREPAFGRIGLGANNTRGLVSRCGHHGLLVTKSRRSQKQASPLASL